MLPSERILKENSENGFETRISFLISGQEFMSSNFDINSKGSFFCNESEEALALSRGEIFARNSESDFACLPTFVLEALY